MDEDIQPVTIPREVFWLCAIAPWLFAQLMMPTLYQLSWPVIVRHIVGLYLPFLATPTVLKVCFDRFAPALLRRARGRFQRFMAYTTLATASSLLASLFTLPLCSWVTGAPMYPSYHLLHGLIITWLFTLPTVVWQEQRARTEASERRARAEREAALEAQLQALQARTQPHFFFNSINTVASLIPDDPQLAEETLVKLADILRYALDSGRTRFVPLARELSVVRDYLEVQKARFESRLNFVIDVDPALHALAVPPLFLQPLVENAVLHGVSQRARGGQVRVSARREQDLTHIEVQDDGVGPGRSTHHGSGTGMNDLAARLRLLYGERGALHGGPAEGGGYRVQVTLPCPEAHE